MCLPRVASTGPSISPKPLENVATWVKLTIRGIKQSPGCCLRSRGSRSSVEPGLGTSRTFRPRAATASRCWSVPLDGEVLPCWKSTLGPQGLGGRLPPWGRQGSQASSSICVLQTGFDHFLCFTLFAPYPVPQIKCILRWCRRIPESFLDS